MAQGWQDDCVIRRLKVHLLARDGTSGIKNCLRQFRSLPTDSDGCISNKEFADALKATGVKCVDHEIKYLCKAYDKKNKGRVLVDEVVKHLIGDLNWRRTKAVEKAWQHFDENGRGVIPVATLNSTFRPQELVAVQTPMKAQGGTQTEDQVKADFTNSFRKELETGIVTREEFLAYYAGLSVSIPYDDYFEAMVLRTWNIDDPAKPRLDATQRDWSATTGVDPLEYVPLIRVDVLKHELGLSLKSYNGDHMKRIQPHIEPNPSVLPDYITTTMKDYPPYNSEQIWKSDPIRERTMGSTAARTAAATADAKIFDGICQKIIRHGGNEGLLPLRRALGTLNVSEELSKDELVALLQQLGVYLSRVEVETLVRSAEPLNANFYRKLRPEIESSSRLAILKAAYKKLSGSSKQPTMGDLAFRWDASGSAKVRSGKISENQARQELVHDFGKAKDDPISWEEFVTYYTDLGCGMTSDREFELLVRTSWQVATAL